MIELVNETLRVQVLDPRTDARYLGARYCVGGYIWQVIDARQGPLFTGPQFPDPEPDTYHGQGAPDMFLKNLGGETAAVGERVGVIGVGDVMRTTKEPFHVATNRDVVGPLAWEIESSPQRVHMQCAHRLRDWAYSLSREITLDGRLLRSTSRLKNEGAITLPLCAFAHPFFPLPAGSRLCRLSVPAKPFENPGFFLDDEQWICRRPGHDWVQGAYQLLDYEKGAPGMEITQWHDRLGRIRVCTDFMPSRLAIWGNDRTFSFEPFIERELAPGAFATWNVEYLL